MNRIIFNFLVITATVLAFVSCTTDQETCTLKGTISGRTSDTLILLKANESPRNAQTFIAIADSAFEFTFDVPQVEAYELVFLDEARHVWKPVIFFPDNKEINFTLFSFDDFDKNQIRGSKLTDKYLKYVKSEETVFGTKSRVINDSTILLLKNNEFYTPEMDSLLKLLRKTKDNNERVEIDSQIEKLRKSGKDKSQKGRELDQRFRALHQEAIEWRYNYISKNIDLVSYFLVLEDMMGIKYNKIDIQYIKNVFSEFTKRYPTHTYSELIKTLIESQESIHVGGRFIDFDAPDLNGTEYQLSDIIKDKIALIDLWASWCGPCIANSRRMIPVYNDFKDKGFTVCGVASEFSNTDQLKARLNKEQFPWLNLVELNNEHGIWDKYGVSNSGGATFLVDKEGTILAINPDPEEVIDILSEKLH